jgi:hypothetical protein
MLDFSVDMVQVYSQKDSSQRMLSKKNQLKISHLLSEIWLNLRKRSR